MKNEHILNEQTNNTPQQNTQLMVREKLPNTPFTLIGNDEIGYFITMGPYRLTEHYPTPAEASEQIQIEQWQIIARMIGIICEQTLQQTLKTPPDEN